MTTLSLSHHPRNFTTGGKFVVVGRKEGRERRKVIREGQGDQRGVLEGVLRWAGLTQKNSIINQILSSGPGIAYAAGYTGVPPLGKAQLVG